MKKLKLSMIGLLTLSMFLNSCSKSSVANATIDTDEYYEDSSGRYILELGDEGFNVYEDGKVYKSSNGSNKEYSQHYSSGICILPPMRQQINLNSLPNKPTKAGKKSISNNFKVIGGGYRVKPKPQFLGGSNYSCYECLLDGIERNDFVLGVCNGSVFFCGSLSDDPSMQSSKSALSQINFNPSQSDQFVQTITSTGLYKCSKR